MNDVYFNCSKMRAIISVPCCERNRNNKKFHCTDCEKPDYLKDPLSIVDMKTHIEKNPGKDNIPHTLRV